MSTNPLIPAAEYVRMSTDDQPNSIALQQAAIRHFADTHGYQVVRTYSDLGKSGLQIKHRTGLSSLLLDAIGGEASFQAILVYDVSRWGRFQDTDESAHYEFLCRSAGIQVHYCAEQFQNIGGLSNDIMKSLKRMMAAEFSRELSSKVKAGMRCLAGQGFRLGGTAGFGMRRALVSPEGVQKKILQPCERKYLKADHVILVPGPVKEVECIRTIFDLAAENEKSPSQITLELNKRGLQIRDGAEWKQDTVYHILKNEKYIGCNVWGKTEIPFGKSGRLVSPAEWIRKPKSFVPIVSADQFVRVQELLQQRRTKPSKPDEFLFKRMREVWNREGKLTERLLAKYRYFDYRTYVKRFGSVMRAYELIGYRPSAHAFASVGAFHKLRQLRAETLARVKNLFPTSVRILRTTNRKQRELIDLNETGPFALNICRPTVSTVSSGLRWLLKAQPAERDLPAIVCFANESLTELTHYYVVPSFGRLIRRYKVLSEDHPWLKAGRRLNSLSEFHDVATQVVKNWQPRCDIIIIGDVTFSSRTSVVTIGEKEVALPNIEAALLKVLANNAGKVVSHAALDEVATQASREQEGRSALPRVYFVRNHISRLRRLLGPLRRRIVTSKCEGYTYSAVVRRDSSLLKLRGLHPSLKR